MDNNYETMFLKLLATDPDTWPNVAKITLNAALEPQAHKRFEQFLDYAHLLPVDSSREREGVLGHIILALFAGMTPRESHNLPDPSQECLAAAVVFEELLNNQIEMPISRTSAELFVKAMKTLGTALNGHLVCHPMMGGAGMGIGTSTPGVLLLKAMGITEMLEAIAKEIVSTRAGFIPQYPSSLNGQGFSKPEGPIGGFKFNFTKFSDN